MLKHLLLDAAIDLPINKNLLGTTIIIAPHPDDESLGCGGIIALLKKAGRKVFIIFVSDGSLSHPHSKKFAHPKLMQLREKEALNAATILGSLPTACYFMRLKDGSVPFENAAGFFDAVNKMENIFKKVKPNNIILPWKNDPHQDHQASWQIVIAALNNSLLKPVLLHYLIWFWERGGMDAELKNNSILFKVDIRSVVLLKQQAIAAHVSQVTRLIDDDQSGFILSEEVLDHFKKPFELLIKIKT